MAARGDSQNLKGPSLVGWAFCFPPKYHHLYPIMGDDTTTANRVNCNQRSNPMMKAIISTWKTLTDTLKVVGQYRSDCLYPLLSFSIMLLVTFTVMIPLLDKVLGPEDVL